MGYYTIMWSLNTHDDRTSATSDQIFATVKVELGPGITILMHLGSAHEPDALPAVLAYIKGQGYGFVTLDQLTTP